MRVIPKNLITAVEATSESGDFVATRLLDEHPGRLWIGNTSRETLTFTVRGESNGFGLVNTNATSAYFTLIDPNAVHNESGVVFETGVNWASVNFNPIALTALNGNTGACAIRWPVMNGELQLKVELLQSEGLPLQAGKAMAGLVYEYANPELGFSERRKPLGFVEPNSNGSIYVKKRGSVRVFGGDIEIGRDDKFHEFMLQIVDIVDLGPAFWWMTDLDNSRWLVYARFTKFPDGKHGNITRTQVSFELTEVR